MCSSGAIRDSERVQLDAHRAAAELQNMRIDHRRRDVGMAQQYLHVADVATRLQQMRREAIAQRVRHGWRVDAGHLHGALERTLEGLVVQVNSALTFTGNPMHTENKKNRDAAQARNAKLSAWQLQADRFERHLCAVVEEAKTTGFFEALHVTRNNANRQIQMFAGQHPVGTAEIETDSKGREVVRRVHAEHGAALVISQSVTGNVAVILYPYESEKAKRTQEYIIWSIVDSPSDLNERLLTKAINDFLLYVRVSSVMFAESWRDRARIQYLEFRGRKYIGSGGVAKVLFSRWFLPTLGALGSIASIFSVLPIK